jgi:hypothetical protein
MRHRFNRWKATCYTLALVSLGYSHPLGLLMGATLALASAIFVRETFDSWRRWLVVHGFAGLLLLPWVGRYLDHPPEHLSGPQPWQSLAGTPIGFLGGDSRTLVGLIALIAWGIGRWIVSPEKAGRDPSRRARAVAPACLLLWLIVPPTALYLYSQVGHPIFGPARYTLFDAPAYLILIALGLSQSPAWLRYPVALVCTGLAAATLPGLVYDSEAKADWRAFAAALDNEATASVIVVSADPARNVEVETARYYLSPRCRVLSLEEAMDDHLAEAGDGPLFLAVGRRGDRQAAAVPAMIGPYRFEPDRGFPGLSVARGRRTTAP